MNDPRVVPQPQGRQGANPGQDRRRGFAAAAIDYSGSDLDPLPATSAGVGELCQLLGQHGMTDCLAEDDQPEPPTDPDRFIRCLDSLLREVGTDDALCIYVGGHGEPVGEDFFVIGPTAGTTITARNSVSARDLGNIIGQSKVGRILLLIDACYSGAGGNAAAQTIAAIDATRRQLKGGDIVIISSARPVDRSTDGAFVGTLLDLLGGDTKRWTSKDQFIESIQLFRALKDKEAASPPPGFSVKSHALDSMGPVLINPSYAPTADVELAIKPLVAEHFLRSASGMEIGEAGSFFTGRSDELQKLTGWIEDEDGTGMFVVTGPPGSGKSAIIGQAVLSGLDVDAAAVEGFPASSNAMDSTGPRRGSILAAIHARNKDLNALRAELATTLALPLGAEESSNSVVAALGSVSNRPVIVIDALDESAGPDRYRIAEMLRQAADVGTVRFAIATRPDRSSSHVGTVLGSSQGRPGSSGLLKRLGISMPDIDLGQSANGPRDVERYLVRRLTHETAEVRYSNEEAAVIAAEVVESTGPIFLFARMAVHRLMSTPRVDFTPGWEGRLPAVSSFDGFGRHVEADLNRIVDPESRRRVRNMLTALAFAEGAGAPRWPIWPAIAEAVVGSGDERPFDDDDVQATLDETGWYLVEAFDQGQTVYRLFHNELIRYFQLAAIGEY